MYLSLAKNITIMRTSQINPQIAINALMGYLGTYNYYYSWYNFIHNTYDNNFTGYVPIPGKENPFIALEEYLREPKPEWYTIIQMRNTLPSIDYRMSLWLIPLWQRIPISSMVLPSISSKINYR